MQAELKAVQQQALATQQSLAQLQTRKSADPYSAIVSELPRFVGVDGTILGVGAALALAGVAVWWYVWQRPRNRWTDAGDTRMQDAAPVSTQAPLQPSHAPKLDTEGWATSTAAGEFSAAGLESLSANARLSRDIAFDSEAAATEVSRVRKSLANKREARAQFLERDEATELATDPVLELDLDLDALHTTPPAQVRLESSMTNPAMPEPEPALDMKSALDLDLNLDPWHQPGEPLPRVADDQTGEAIHFSLALDAYGLKPDAPTTPDAPTPYELDMEPTPAPSTRDYDFTITMALAQESAALELWTEARDLATEVLASDNAELVAQANALLERLNQLEQDAPPDTSWSTVR